MSDYAKCWHYHEGETFPCLDEDMNLKYFPCDETLYEYSQPDELDNHEFNIILEICGKQFRARGCHFDFIHE